MEIKFVFKNTFTYISDGKEYFCEKHDIYNQSSNISFSSLNQMQLNVPEPVEPRNSTNIFPDSDEDYPTENNLNQTDFSHTKPIVIESDYTKYDKFTEVDSANHSFDDGIDVVDGLIKTNGVNGCDYSVDSGISNNLTNGHSNIINNEEQINGIENGEIKEEKILKILPSRLSDLSLKLNENGMNSSSDEDKFESDQEVSPRTKKCKGHINGTEKNNGISLNLRLQCEMRQVNKLSFLGVRDQFVDKPI